LAALAALASAVSGCGLVGTADDDPSADQPRAVLAPLGSVETVTVHHHEVATRCAGDPQDPAVLLVAGYDTPLAAAWDDVQQQIGAFARVCAYDRLGVGDSDPAPRRQDFTDMATLLDGVLDALDLERPVVLVAHSLGGMVAATWAESHRKDAAGLVLLDATPPSYVSKALDLLPPGSARGATLRAGLESLMRPSRNAERLDGAEGFAVTPGPVGDVPVLALTHSVSDWGDVRRRVAAQLDSAWLGGQQDWAGLSTVGQVRLVDRAGHDIQHDQPQAVVDAVHEVVGGSAG
jgi:pimeloyl-ACP methyl ester carboxylesterase